MKSCLGCCENKELSQYYLNKTGYYHPYCKDCNRTRTREWRAINTHKHYLNKAKGKYKISKENYLILFNSQNGKCSICLKIDERRLSIDHCHKTGKVRGLLCRKCNSAIGYFCDDVELLKKAVVYLT